MSGSTFYKRAVELMEAELGDDIVALEPRAGKCFGFNEVAATVWRQLEQPRDFEQLKNCLMEEYQVDEDQCARDLAELLVDMTAKGLISSS
jgi:hypothetical protein